MGLLRTAVFMRVQALTIDASSVVQTTTSIPVCATKMRVGANLLGAGFCATGHSIPDNWAERDYRRYADLGKRVLRPNADDFTHDRRSNVNLCAAFVGHFIDEFVNDIFAHPTRIHAGSSLVLLVAARAACVAGVGAAARASGSTL